MNLYYKIVKPNNKGELVGFYPLNEDIRIIYHPEAPIIEPKVKNSKILICSTFLEADKWFYHGFDSRQIWEVEAYEVEEKVGLVIAPTDEEVYSYWKGKTKGMLLDNQKATVCSSLKMIRRID